jgi:RluA family pseudouridine synthase
VDILLEDEHCLAVCKPAGLSTQAPRGIDCLEVRVREMLAARAGVAASPQSEIYLGLPHRLDRPVSGVLLLAKTRRAARIISRQFERRQVRKLYWACVAGVVEPADGEWSDFVRKVPDEPRAQICAPSSPDAQQAVLRYERLGATEDYSFLEIELETGRMHQIRLQSASRSHPILGDELYGSQISFGPQTDDLRERAIALHARSLSFRHPETKQTLTLIAPPPASWRDFDDHTLS